LTVGGDGIGGCWAGSVWDDVIKKIKGIASVVKSAGPYRRIWVTLFLTFFSFDHELKKLTSSFSKESDILVWTW
jgi:hypothetical protein